MSLDKLHTWEKSIWQWRSGGLAVYDAGIVGLAGALCASMAFMSHLSLRKAMSALFNLRNVGLLLAVWALQLGLMSGDQYSSALLRLDRYFEYQRRSPA